VNLLPRPRSSAFDDTRVAAREPVVRVDASLPPEGYRLTISKRGVEVVAADDAGAFYARATLAQLAHLHDGMLPVGTVDDWPDLPVRGVMLDISRDKVPTPATLRELIARLASWKVNQVHLYMEHTFAYRDHEEVWASASPLTSDEVRVLDRFCRAHHVELVPNRNCLGHMERWLKHHRYRLLAIAPDGWTDHRGRVRAPTTLDPAKPAALALVRELLAELLEAFTSARVHVGLDEPWELPPERATDYLDWVAALRALPELEGREMLLWGDILANHPELVDALPGGVTVCEWGYEDWHPFAARASTLAAAERPFWVCPGTSSWLSILGRVTNAVGNCAAAADAAQAHGGSGLLVTDWGDMGHLQYLPVSEPALAYAAAVSWCLETNRDLDLRAALDVHVFDDPAGEIGGAVMALGDLHREVTPQFFNLSTLVTHLYFPQLQLDRGFTAGITGGELARVEERLADAAATLDRSHPRRPDGALALDELRNAAALVSLQCRDGRARLEADGWLASVPESRREGFAAALAPLIDTHRNLWLARNRAGGLDDSCAWLENLRRAYLTGVTDRRWGGW
jgi:hexosaminidase